MSTSFQYTFSETEQKLISAVAEELQYQMRSHKPPEEIQASVQRIIYDLLTSRPEFQNRLRENPDFALEGYASLEPYRRIYTQHIEALEAMFPSSENVGWLQMNCHNLPKSPEALNFKLYKTLHPFRLEFLDRLPALHRKLQEL